MFFFELRAFCWTFERLLCRTSKDFTAAVGQIQVQGAGPEADAGADERFKLLCEV